MMRLSRQTVKKGLEHDEFFLAYQPIVELASRRPIGLEALVRWKHPLHGELGPVLFIRECERIGAIADLGVWVARRAMSEAAQWHRAARAVGRDLFLSVNVSGYELQQPEYGDALVALCGDFEHRCQELQVEVIESDFNLRGQEVHDNLQVLRREEIKVLVDDFGKGASTPERVAEISADGLKLDGSIIRSLETDEAAALFLDTILVAAAAAGLEVVAEGIETEEQRALLLAHGCRYGQGFLFSRPVPASAVPDILAA